MWRKGESGNPHGRPRKVSSALDRAVNRHVAQKLAYAMIKEAVRGDVGAYITIRETIEGKLPQAVTGPEGGPLQLMVVDIATKAP